MYVESRKNIANFLEMLGVLTVCHEWQRRRPQNIKYAYAKKKPMHALHVRGRGNARESLTKTICGPEVKISPSTSKS
jgi:hypothetical protein